MQKCLGTSQASQWQFSSKNFIPPQNLDDQHHAWKRVENNCVKKEEIEADKKAVNT